MNEGVTITFAVIFVLVAGIGLVLFKEARTHRFWRDLVAANDLDAIRGILDGEIERWRTQRPPKGVSAAVWAGVQAMELLRANARYVSLATSAEPEFRMVEGKQRQVATALDTARATSVQLLEMVFYDVPNYRPEVVRVDVYSAFRGADGRTEPQPILSVTAEREDAMYADWDADPREILADFEVAFALNDAGDAAPIQLPAERPELVAAEEPEQESQAEDRRSSVG